MRSGSQMLLKPRAYELHMLVRIQAVYSQIDVKEVL